MKILNLRFKNLNSLQGEWQIDFTDPAYTENGIFALTGPTGAGKSTILDAICLALYGETPRLGKISKSDNEIMSRQTGECYAEVVFQTHEGSFRCQWAQRRARKAAAGKLQDPEHQIAEADSGKLIESKKSLVLAAVENKTGMNFERFSRSILLAQGSFDSFLKANVGDKSEILEQITGTEIYSEISRQTHERQRAEQAQLEFLQAQVNGIQVLTDEEEAEIKREQADKQAVLAAGRQQQEQARAVIHWLNGLVALEAELAGLVQEQEQWQQAQAAFAPTRQQWQAAQRAAYLESDYAALQSLRRQQQEEQAALAGLAAGLPVAQSLLQTYRTELDQAGGQHQAAKAKQKADWPLWQQIRTMDADLAAQRQVWQEQEQRCAGWQQQLAELAGEQQAQQRQQESKQKEWDGLRTWFAEHAADEWLVTNFAGLQEQFKQWHKQQQSLQQQQAAFRQAQQRRADTQAEAAEIVQQTEQQRQQAAKAGKELVQAEAGLAELLAGRLLREYRSEKEALLREQMLWKKIADYQTERQQLRDGHACPLCGALSHPFAEDGAPQKNDLAQRIVAIGQLIEEAEQQEEACLKHHQTHQQALHALELGEKHEEQVKLAEQAAIAGVDEKKQQLAEAEAENDALRAQISEALAPLGLAETGDNAADLTRQLQQRLTDWQKMSARQDDIRQALVKAEAESRRLAGVAETRQADWQAAQRGLPALKAAWQTGMRQRQALFGDKNVAEEEQRAAVAVDEAAKQEAAAQSRFHQQQQALALLEQQEQQSRKRLVDREPLCRQAEAVFQTGLQQQGFADEADFQAAALPQEQRDELQQQAAALDEQRVSWLARHQDRSAKLAEERAKSLSEEPLDEWMRRLEQLDDYLAVEQAQLARLVLRLEDDKQARARVGAQQQAVEKQQEVCRQWNRLHALIGSADGKKYRNFAQGLTFELMVAQANRQLQKMTDRYLLLRDAQEPLALNVLDQYQAGEIRSIKNLSGGESFIISLALALGLSGMASRKVRVDSLFLDEGFGTLDEEALDTALETLSGLHEEGKLIGVISHVSALKDNIATQIKVRPLNGGRSEISGPGCRYG